VAMRGDSRRDQGLLPHCTKRCSRSTRAQRIEYTYELHRYLHFGFIRIEAESGGGRPRSPGAFCPPRQGAPPFQVNFLQDNGEIGSGYRGML